MIRNLYGILDVKANTFRSIFPSNADGEAIRGLQSLVNGNHESDIAMYPEDFSLYRLGTWDDVTGYIAPAGDRPELLIQASALKRSASPEEVSIPRIQ